MRILFLFFLVSSLNGGSVVLKRGGFYVSNTVSFDGVSGAVTVDGNSSGVMYITILSISEGYDGVLRHYQANGKWWCDFEFWTDYIDPVDPVDPDNNVLEIPFVNDSGRGQRAYFDVYDKDGNFVETKEVWLEDGESVNVEFSYDESFTVVPRIVGQDEDGVWGYVEGDAIESTVNGTREPSEGVIDFVPTITPKDSPDINDGVSDVQTVIANKAVEDVKNTDQITTNNDFNTDKIVAAIKAIDIPEGVSFELPTVDAPTDTGMSQSELDAVIDAASQPTEQSEKGELEAAGFKERLADLLPELPAIPDSFGGRNYVHNMDFGTLHGIPLKMTFDFTAQSNWIETLRTLMLLVMVIVFWFRVTALIRGAFTGQ